MKPIAQEETMGCGVACVAFLCRKSYSEAKKLFARQSKGGYFCRDLVKALAKCRKKYAWKKYRNGEKLLRNSIVFIARSRKYTAGHYMVKTAHGWMDPWINFPQLNVKAGQRKKLPGKARWVVHPEPQA